MDMNDDGGDPLPPPAPVIPNQTVFHFYPKPNPARDELKRVIDAYKNQEKVLKNGGKGRLLLHPCIGNGVGCTRMRASYDQLKLGMHLQSLYFDAVVLKKGEIHTGVGFLLFDLHLEMVPDRKKLYCTIWQRRALHAEIQEGKVYRFISPKIGAGMYYTKYDPFDNNFVVLVRSSVSCVVPVNAPVIPKLHHLCMESIADLVEDQPDLFVDRVKNLPRDILEHFVANHARFSTLMSWYYSPSLDTTLISSLFMTQCINLRERDKKHIISEHLDDVWKAPYFDLWSVFDDMTPFECTTKDDIEQKIFLMMATEESIARKATSYPVVRNLSEFQRNFSAFTLDMLEGLDWANWFCAGGSVLACLRSLPESAHVNDERGLQAYYQTDCSFASSDVDLFLYGLTETDDIDNKMLQAYETISNNLSRVNSQYFVVRTKNAVTIVTTYPYRLIQLIVMKHPSPAAVLSGFDLDCVCVGYNGDKVYATARALRAITRRYNLIDPAHSSKSYEYRLYKYCKRGYCVGFPGINDAQVSTDKLARLFEGNVAYADMSTLSRLQFFQLKFFSEKLKAAGKLKSEVLEASLNQKLPKKSDEFLNSYSTFIPWGPQHTAQSVANSLVAREDPPPLAKSMLDLISLVYPDDMSRVVQWPYSSDYDNKSGVNWSADVLIDGNEVVGDPHYMPASTIDTDEMNIEL